MEPILRVEGVSKKYSRNANAHLGYGLQDLFAELIGRPANPHRLRKDEFWAVKDISFDLYPGDTFALVGRNGSGKTTLLKMLHGLTKPDAGRIVITGNVQAIINLGAGFSPNLSGRNNVYTAASLLGLNKRQTNDIMDAIIDFAELEDFIDSPVGTYSSGMKARLGFAVAVHLQPDILLIDEVLAVGDFAFQNKCFIRMEALKKQGVSIILISHSHAKVLQLCERALWLHEGKAMAFGQAGEVVKSYLDFLEREEEKRTRKRDEKAAVKTAQSAEGALYGPVYTGDSRIDAVHCELLVNGEPTDSAPIHSDVIIRFSFTLKDDIADLHATVNIFRKDGALVSALATMKRGELRGVRTGKVTCEAHIRNFNLCPGAYVIMLPICEGRSYLFRDVVKEFYVTGGGEVFWGFVDLDYHIEVENPLDPVNS